MVKFKQEIKWAIIFVIMSLFWMVLERVAGLHHTHIDKHLYLTNFFAIPAVWIYVLAIIDKKNNHYNGQMTYIQGFISGFFITIFVAILSPLNQWVISTLITPDYFSNAIAYALDSGYHDSRKEAEAYFNLRNYMFQSFVGSLIMGIMTSLIVPLFIRSRSK